MSSPNRSLRRPPTVPGLPILGVAPGLRRDNVLALLGEAHRTLGDVFRLRIGFKDNYVVAHPDHAAYVLQENARNYTKSRSYQRLRLMLGHGLVTSEGERWRRQRSVTQPFFNRQRITSLTGAMAGIVDARLDRWDEALRRGDDVDVKSECKVLSLLLVARGVLGRDVSGDAGTLVRATEALSSHVERERLAFLRLPASVPTPRNLMARYYRHCVDQVVREVLSADRHGEAGGLVATLLEARDQGGGRGFDDAQVHDQIVTIMVAGYETTAAALGWTLFLVARHRDVADRLRAEVDAVVGRRLPTAEDLPRLDYTEMVVQESLRLYPPVWVIGRRSVQADALGGYEIPAGASVGIYPFLMHRHPELWTRPAAFDPERFAPAAVAARPRLAHLPFGGGSRQCIGNHLSMLELTLCLAMMTQRFCIHVPPDYQPKLEPGLTLSPPEGMPLRLSARRD